MTLRPPPGGINGVRVRALPDLDFALLADYVRVDGGIAHAIAAGIDTVYAPEVPTGQNLGLLFRAEFTRNECDRPHRIEMILQDIDGQRLVHLTTVVTPSWDADLPVGWNVGMLGGLNFGAPLPAYGVYSLEILINDHHQKTIRLRVEPPPPEMTSGGPVEDRPEEP